MVLFLISAIAKAENYMPPAEGPVAFRIDRMPVEVVAMVQISDHLINLAKANPGKTPEELRRVAQTLALAIALDPTNSTKRQMLADYGGVKSSSIDNERLARSHRILWKYLSWLESPQAGADAHALAYCLTDILAYSDHSHPKAESLREAGEKGAWAGWIPDLAAYRPAPKIPAPVPKPALPPAQNTKTHLASAEIKTLLWSQTQDKKSWVRAVLPIKMSAEKFEPGEDDPRRRFQLRVGDDSNNERLEDTVKDALAVHHRELPDKLRVVIQSEQLDQSLESGRTQGLSAAMFVLASSAITGDEPDATVLGIVTDKGEYKLSSEFWHQMRDLQTASGGGRLILPIDATEHLLGVLAVENPDFFFKYDVVLAANTSELLRFARKKLPDADAAIFTSFEEIRSKRGNISPGFYITNNFVRPRLVELAGRAPWFASAKMLAMQASGNRPTRLSRNILSSEIMIALEPIANLVNRRMERPNTAYVKGVESVYETSRKAIDDLTRYVDSAERPLHEKARALTTQTRTFGRTCDKYKNYNYYDDGGLEAFYVVEPVQSGHRQLLRAYNALKEELTGKTRP